MYNPKAEAWQHCTERKGVNLHLPHYPAEAWLGATQQEFLEIDNESVIVRRTPPFKQIIDKNRFSYVDYFFRGNEAKEIAVWRPESLAAFQLPSVANFNGQIIKFLMRHQSNFIKEICALRRCLKPFYSLCIGSHLPGTLLQVAVLQKFGLCWYILWKNRDEVASSLKAEMSSCSLFQAYSALQ